MSTGAGDWSIEDIQALSREVRASIAGAPEDHEAAETDFGRLVRRTAIGVLTPRTADEVERIVAYANQRGLKLTARGRGMSQGGQSIPSAGVSLDLSRITSIDAPDSAARTVHCGAGTSWRDVIAMTAPHGLLPKVVPLNLDLTVGGLLSVAGVGATSHRYGAAVACAPELEVVTGGGRRLVCSESRERSVYEASLGGLGRAAVIVGARIALRPFARNVRTFYLLFDEIEPWLGVQRMLIASRGAEYLEGFCTPCVQGLRDGPRGRGPFAQWFYALHVTVEFDDRAPSASEVLGNLDRFRVVHEEDSATVAFAARYDPRFVSMRRSGAWTQAHPWVEAMLPGDKLHELLPAILAAYPVAFGDGPRVAFVERSGTPPFVSMPLGPEVACCALLPTGVPPHLLADTLDTLRGIHGLIVRGGGKRVLSGWTTMMDERALDEHYGERAADWSSVRRALDPHGILDSPLTKAS
jgi:cytokinin dehydrogenase